MDTRELTRAQLDANQKPLVPLREKIIRQAEQLAVANRNNHERNRELDALRYVWCDGGCDGGVGRWTGEEITEEIVQLAERNTRRLRAWYENHKAREDR